MSSDVTLATEAYGATAPHQLVGAVVNARPFYHVPAERDGRLTGSASSAHAERAFPGNVVAVFAPESVLVAFDPGHGAPGRTRQLMLLRELHARACACPACSSRAQVPAHRRCECGCLE